VLVALAGVIGVGVAACGGGVPPGAAPTTPVPGSGAGAGADVLVVGDSITSQTCDQETTDAVPRCASWVTLERLLRSDGFGAVTVSAQWGRTTDEGLEILRGLDAGLPTVLVVALGTNDILLNDVGDPVAPPADRLQALAEEMVALAGPDRRVLWVNLQLDRTLAAEQGRQANALLADSDARLATLRAADWQAFSAARPEWFTADGVHLTPAGVDAWRSFVRTSVADWAASGWA
jgi:lysophospholipase L1-like esterase